MTSHRRFCKLLSKTGGLAAVLTLLHACAWYAMRTLYTHAQSHLDMTPANESHSQTMLCVWIAGALKSRLPRCVPPCPVAVLVAMQLGRCVGRTWWITGYEPKCGHCAALMSAGMLLACVVKLGDSGPVRQRSWRVSLCLKKRGMVWSQKAGGRCTSSARSLAWRLVRRLTVGAVAQAQRPLPDCTHCTLHAWAAEWGECVWIAGALKSRLPRCVPPCLVAVLVAMQLGRCVGRTWWITDSNARACSIVAQLLQCKADHLHGSIVENLCLTFSLIAFGLTNQVRSSSGGVALSRETNHPCLSWERPFL